MVYVGTCGYSYKEWIGPFYPEGTKDSHMLDYYSGAFNFVEINSSFYHMPRLQLFESISKRTPGSFKAAVKLFQGFTHSRDAGSELAEQFMYSVNPLVESEKLMCLLAQFPYSFHCTPENMDYLKKLRHLLKDVEINVEFRNQGWIKGQVIELLRQENLGFVCVDEPAIKGLIRNVLVSTSKVAYLRLHGRNAEKWYEGEGSERYDYLYSRDELMEWVPRIKELEENAPVTVIAFNNHPKGKAVENAKTLISLLSE